MNPYFLFSGSNSGMAGGGNYRKMKIIKKDYQIAIIITKNFRKIKPKFAFSYLDGEEDYQRAAGFASQQFSAGPGRLCATSSPE